MVVLITILLGVFLGTFGSAWTHYFVHKFNLLESSIIWKNHLQHHLGVDTEQADRRKYTMPVYSLIRTLTYLEFSRWTWLDFGLFVISITFPVFGFAFLIGIFITENFGFLQHTYDGDCVDFTNKFWNKIANNQGYHSEHHGESVCKHSTDVEVITGLVAAYAWLFVSLLLYPVMVLNWAKPTVKGAYIFGFFTNLANYKAMEGISMTPLLRRMPSIFDNPKILIHYMKIIFRKEKNVLGKTSKYIDKTSKLKQSHDISGIRNVYKENPSMIKNKEILIYKDEILEGHHRHFSLEDAQRMSGLVYIKIS